MVGVPGLEPGTSSLSGTRSNQLSYTPKLEFGFCPSSFHSSGSFVVIDSKWFTMRSFLLKATNGGATGTRTLDIQLAKLALYQLSYSPRYIYCVI